MLNRKFRTTHRIIAFLTVITFTAVNTASAAPGVSAAAPSAQEVKTSSLVSRIEIPESLGTITERFDPSGQNSAVIHIQDAHASLEAQEHIRRILHHLKEEYGVNLVLVEGGIGELQGKKLNVFEKEEFNQQLAERLLAKGILSGSERFLLDETSSSSPARVMGIESADIYLKNLNEYRKVLNSKEESISFLESLKTLILTFSSQYFNSKLQKFFKEWVALQDRHEALLRKIQTLEQYAASELQIDFEKPETQMDWPHMVRLSKLNKLEKELDVKAAGGELETLKQWLNEKKAEGLTIEAVKNFDPAKGFQAKSENGSRELLQNFYEETRGLGFSFNTYPALSKVWGHVILREELDAVLLFDETSLLTDKILEKLAVSEKEKSLVQTYKNFLLLSNVLKLELSDADYTQVIARKDAVKPSAILASLSSSKDISKIEEIFQQALSFYRNAKNRDKIMFDRMAGHVKNLKAENAVIITGGFHSEGLEAQLKEKQIAYVEIQPRINDLNQSSDYEKAMLLQGAPKASAIAFGKPATDPQAPRELIDYAAPIISTERDAILRSESRLSIPEPHEPGFAEERLAQEQPVLTSDNRPETSQQVGRSESRKPIETTDQLLRYLLSTAKARAVRVRDAGRKVSNTALMAKAAALVIAKLQNDVWRGNVTASRIEGVLEEDGVNGVMELFIQGARHYSTVIHKTLTPSEKRKITEDQIENATRRFIRETFNDYATDPVYRQSNLFRYIQENSDGNSQQLLRAVLSSLFEQSSFGGPFGGSSFMVITQSQLEHMRIKGAIRAMASEQAEAGKSVVSLSLEAFWNFGRMDVMVDEIQRAIAAINGDPEEGYTFTVVDAQKLLYRFTARSESRRTRGVTEFRVKNGQGYALTNRLNSAEAVLVLLNGRTNDGRIVLRFIHPDGYRFFGGSTVSKPNETLVTASLQQKIAIIKDRTDVAEVRGLHFDGKMVSLDINSYGNFDLDRLPIHVRKRMEGLADILESANSRREAQALIELRDALKKDQIGFQDAIAAVKALDRVPVENQAEQNYIVRLLNLLGEAQSRSESRQPEKQEGQQPKRMGAMDYIVQVAAKANLSPFGEPSELMSLRGAANDDFNPASLTEGEIAVVKKVVKALGLGGKDKQAQRQQTLVQITKAMRAVTKTSDGKIDQAKVQALETAYRAKYEDQRAAREAEELDIFSGLEPMQQLPPKINKGGKLKGVLPFLARGYDGKVPFWILRSNAGNLSDAQIRKILENSNWEVKSSVLGFFQKWGPRSEVRMNAGETRKFSAFSVTFHYIDGQTIHLTVTPQNGLSKRLQVLPDEERFPFDLQHSFTARVISDKTIEVKYVDALRGSLEEIFQQKKAENLVDQILAAARERGDATVAISFRFAGDAAYFMAYNVDAATGNIGLEMVRSYLEENEQTLNSGSETVYEVHRDGNDIEFIPFAQDGQMSVRDTSAAQGIGVKGVSDTGIPLDDIQQQAAESNVIVQTGVLHELLTYLGIFGIAIAFIGIFASGAFLIAGGLLSIVSFLAQSYFKEQLIIRYEDPLVPSNTQNAQPQLNPRIFSKPQTESRSLLDPEVRHAASHPLQARSLYKPSMFRSESRQASVLPAFLSGLEQVKTYEGIKLLLSILRFPGDVQFWVNGGASAEAIADLKTAFNVEDLTLTAEQGKQLSRKNPYWVFDSEFDKAEAAAIAKENDILKKGLADGTLVRWLHYSYGGTVYYPSHGEAGSYPGVYNEDLGWYAEGSSDHQRFLANPGGTAPSNEYILSSDLSLNRDEEMVLPAGRIPPARSEARIAAKELLRQKLSEIEGWTAVNWDAIPSSIFETIEQLTKQGQDFTVRFTPQTTRKELAPGSGFYDGGIPPTNYAGDYNPNPEYVDVVDEEQVIEIHPAAKRSESRASAKTLAVVVFTGLASALVTAFFSRTASMLLLAAVTLLLIIYDKIVPPVFKSEKAAPEELQAIQEFMQQLLASAKARAVKVRDAGRKISNTVLMAEMAVRVYGILENDLRDQLITAQDIHEIVSSAGGRAAQGFIIQIIERHAVSIHSRLGADEQRLISADNIENAARRFLREEFNAYIRNPANKNSKIVTYLAKHADKESRDIIDTIEELAFEVEQMRGIAVMFRAAKEGRLSPGQISDVLKQDIVQWAVLTIGRSSTGAFGVTPADIQGAMPFSMEITPEEIERAVAGINSDKNQSVTLVRVANPDPSSNVPFYQIAVRSESRNIDAVIRTLQSAELRAREVGNAAGQQSLDSVQPALVAAQRLREKAGELETEKLSGTQAVSFDPQSLNNELAQMFYRQARNLEARSEIRIIVAIAAAALGVVYLIYRGISSALVQRYIHQYEENQISEEAALQKIALMWKTANAELLARFEQDSFPSPIVVKALARSTDPKISSLLKQNAQRYFLKHFSDARMLNPKNDGGLRMSAASDILAEFHRVKLKETPALVDRFLNTFKDFPHPAKMAVFRIKMTNAEPALISSADAIEASRKNESEVIRMLQDEVGMIHRQSDEDREKLAAYWEELLRILSSYGQEGFVQTERKDLAAFKDKRAEFHRLEKERAQKASALVRQLIAVHARGSDVVIENEDEAVKQTAALFAAGESFVFDVKTHTTTESYMRSATFEENIDADRYSIVVPDTREVLHISLLVKPLSKSANLPSMQAVFPLLKTAGIEVYNSEIISFMANQSSQKAQELAEELKTSDDIIYMESLLRQARQYPVNWSKVSFQNLVKPLRGFGKEQRYEIEFRAERHDSYYEKPTEFSNFGDPNDTPVAVNGGWKTIDEPQIFNVVPRSESRVTLTAPEISEIESAFQAVHAADLPKQISEAHAILNTQPVLNDAAGIQGFIDQAAKNPFLVTGANLSGSLTDIKASSQLGQFAAPKENAEHPEYLDALIERLQKLGESAFEVHPGQGGSSATGNVLHGLGFTPNLHVWDGTDPVMLNALLASLAKLNLSQDPKQIRQQLHEKLPDLLPKLLLVPMAFGMTSEEAVINLAVLYRIFEELGIAEQMKPRIQALTIPGSSLEQAMIARGMASNVMQPTLNGEKPSSPGRGTAPAHTPIAFYPIYLETLRTQGAEAAKKALMDWNQAALLNSDEIQVFEKLAVLMDHYVREGKNKFVLVLPPQYSALEEWIKQIFEESEGIKNKTVYNYALRQEATPWQLKIVTNEQYLNPNFYADPEGSDRVFLRFTFDGVPFTQKQITNLVTLKQAGHPVIDLHFGGNREALATVMQGMHQTAATLIGYLWKRNFVTQPSVENYKAVAKKMIVEAMTAGGFLATVEDAKDSNKYFNALVAWVLRADADKGSIQQSAYYQEIHNKGITFDLKSPMDAGRVAASVGQHIELSQGEPAGIELVFGGDLMRSNDGKSMRRTIDALADKIRIQYHSTVDITAVPLHLHSTHEARRNENGLSIIIVPEDYEEPILGAYANDYIKAQVMAAKEALEDAGRRVVTIYIPKNNKDARRLLLNTIGQIQLRSEVRLKAGETATLPGLSVTFNHRDNSIIHVTAAPENGLSKRLQVLPGEQHFPFDLQHGFSVRVDSDDADVVIVEAAGSRSESRQDLTQDIIEAQIAAIKQQVGAENVTITTEGAFPNPRAFAIKVKSQSGRVLLEAVKAVFPAKDFGYRAWSVVSEGGRYKLNFTSVRSESRLIILGALGIIAGFAWYVAARINQKRVNREAAERQQRKDEEFAQRQREAAQRVAELKAAHYQEEAISPELLKVIQRAVVQNPLTDEEILAGIQLMIRIETEKPKINFDIDPYKLETLLDQAIDSYKQGAGYSISITPEIKHWGKVQEKVGVEWVREYITDLGYERDVYGEVDGWVYEQVGNIQLIPLRSESRQQRAKWHGVEQASARPDEIKTPWVTEAILRQHYNSSAARYVRDMERQEVGNSLDLTDLLDEPKDKEVDSRSEARATSQSWLELLGELYYHLRDKFSELDKRRVMNYFYDKDYKVVQGEPERTMIFKEFDLLDANVILWIMDRMQDAHYAQTRVAHPFSDDGRKTLTSAKQTVEFYTNYLGHRAVQELKKGNQKVVDQIEGFLKGATQWKMHSSYYSNSFSEWANEALEQLASARSEPQAEAPAESRGVTRASGWQFIVEQAPLKTMSGSIEFDETEPILEGRNWEEAHEDISVADVPYWKEAGFAHYEQVGIRGPWLEIFPHHVVYKGSRYRTNVFPFFDYVQDEFLLDPRLSPKFRNLFNFKGISNVLVGERIHNRLAPYRKFFLGEKEDSDRELAKILGKILKAVKLGKPIQLPQDLDEKVANNSSNLHHEYLVVKLLVDAYNRNPRLNKYNPPANRKAVKQRNRQSRSESRKMKDVLPVWRAKLETIKERVGLDIDGGFTYPNRNFEKIVVDAFSTELPAIINIFNANAVNQAEETRIPPGIWMSSEDLLEIVSNLENAAPKWQELPDAKNHWPQLIFAVQEINGLVEEIDRFSIGTGRSESRWMIAGTDLSDKWQRLVASDEIRIKSKDPRPGATLDHEIQYGLAVVNGVIDFRGIDLTDNGREMAERVVQTAIPGSDYYAQFNIFRSLRPGVKPLALGRQPELPSHPDNCAFGCKDETKPASILARTPILQFSPNGRLWDAFHNVSVFERGGHVIIVPHVDKQDTAEIRLQRLLERDIQDMIHTARRSDNLLLFYNSPFAGASVNHIHFQGVYRDKSVPYAMEKTPATLLFEKDGVKVSELADYPAHGYVFEGGEEAAQAKVVAQLTEYFQSQTPDIIPFNAHFLDNKIYVFPRNIDHAIVEELPGGAIASYELAGRIITTNQSAYEALTKERIDSALRKTTLPVDQAQEIMRQVYGNIARSESRMPKKLDERIISESEFRDAFRKLRKNASSAPKTREEREVEAWTQLQTLRDEAESIFRKATRGEAEWLRKRYNFSRYGPPQSAYTSRGEGLLTLNHHLRRKTIPISIPEIYSIVSSLDQMLRERNFYEKLTPKVVSVTSVFEALLKELWEQQLNHLAQELLPDLRKYAKEWKRDSVFRVPLSRLTKSMRHLDREAFEDRRIPQTVSLPHYWEILFRANSRLLVRYDAKYLYLEAYDREVLREFIGSLKSRSESRKINMVLGELSSMSVQIVDDFFVAGTFKEVLKQIAAESQYDAIGLVANDAIYQALLTSPERKYLDTVEWTALPSDPAKRAQAVDVLLNLIEHYKHTSMPFLANTTHYRIDRARFTAANTKAVPSSLKNKKGLMLLISPVQSGLGSAPDEPESHEGGSPSRLPKSPATPSRGAALEIPVEITPGLTANEALEAGMEQELESPSAVRSESRTPSSFVVTYQGGVEISESNMVAENTARLPLTVDAAARENLENIFGVKTSDPGASYALIFDEKGFVTIGRFTKLPESENIRMGVEGFTFQDQALTLIQFDDRVSKILERIEMSNAPYKASSIPNSSIIRLRDLGVNSENQSQLEITFHPSESHVTPELAQKFSEKIRYISAIALPGAGKGSLFKRFLNELNAFLPEDKQYVYLETGDWFRNVKKAAENPVEAQQNPARQVYYEIYAKNPELYHEAIVAIKKGDLVKDATVITMINDILMLPEYKQAYGIIFDGFPRTGSQIKEFNDNGLRLADETEIFDMNLFVVIEASPTTAAQRILRRAQKAEEAGEEVRPDDLDPVVIQARIDTAIKETGPLMEDAVEFDHTIWLNGQRSASGVYDQWLESITAYLERSETRDENSIRFPLDLTEEFLPADDPAKQAENFRFIALRQMTNDQKTLLDSLFKSQIPGGNQEYILITDEDGLPVLFGKTSTIQASEWETLFANNPDVLALKEIIQKSQTPEIRIYEHVANLDLPDSEDLRESALRALQKSDKQRSAKIFLPKEVESTQIETLVVQRTRQQTYQVKIQYTPAVRSESRDEALLNLSLSGTAALASVLTAVPQIRSEARLKQAQEKIREAEGLKRESRSTAALEAFQEAKSILVSLMPPAGAAPQNAVQRIAKFTLLAVDKEIAELIDYKENIPAAILAGLGSEILNNEIYMEALFLFMAPHWHISGITDQTTVLARAARWAEILEGKVTNLSLEDDSDLKLIEKFGLESPDTQLNYRGQTIQAWRDELKAALLKVTTSAPAVSTVTPAAAKPVVIADPSPVPQAIDTAALTRGIEEAASHTAPVAVVTTPAAANEAAEVDLLEQTNEPREAVVPLDGYQARVEEMDGMKVLQIPTAKEIHTARYDGALSGRNMTVNNFQELWDRYRTLISEGSTISADRLGVANALNRRKHFTEGLENIRIPLVEGSPNTFTEDLFVAMLRYRGISSLMPENDEQLALDLFEAHGALSADGRKPQKRVFDQFLENIRVYRELLKTKTDGENLTVRTVDLQKAWSIEKSGHASVRRGRFRKSLGALGLTEGEFIQRLWNGIQQTPTAEIGGAADELTTGPAAVTAATTAATTPAASTAVTAPVISKSAQEIWDEVAAETLQRHRARRDAIQNSRWSPVVSVHGNPVNLSDIAERLRVWFAAVDQELLRRNYPGISNSQFTLNREQFTNLIFAYRDFYELAPTRDLPDEILAKTLAGIIGLKETHAYELLRILFDGMRKELDWDRTMLVYDVRSGKPAMRDVPKYMLPVAAELAADRPAVTTAGSLESADSEEALQKARDKWKELHAAGVSVTDASEQKLYVLALQAYQWIAAQTNSETVRVRNLFKLDLRTIFGIFTLYRMAYRESRFGMFKRVAMLREAISVLQPEVRFTNQEGRNLKLLLEKALISTVPKIAGTADVFSFIVSYDANETQMPSYVRQTDDARLVVAQMPEKEIELAHPDFNKRELKEIFRAYVLYLREQGIPPSLGTLQNKLLVSETEIGSRIKDADQFLRSKHFQGLFLLNYDPTPVQRQFFKALTELAKLPQEQQTVEHLAQMPAFAAFELTQIRTALLSHESVWAQMLNWYAVRYPDMKYRAVIETFRQSAQRSLDAALATEQAAKAAAPAPAAAVSTAPVAVPVTPAKNPELLVPNEERLRVIERDELTDFAATLRSRYINLTRETHLPPLRTALEERFNGEDYLRRAERELNDVLTRHGMSHLVILDRSFPPLLGRIAKMVMLAASGAYPVEKTTLPAIIDSYKAAKVAEEEILSILSSQNDNHWNQLIQWSQGFPANGKFENLVQALRAEAFERLPKPVEVSAQPVAEAVTAAAAVPEIPSAPKVVSLGYPVFERIDQGEVVENFGYFSTRVKTLYAMSLGELMREFENVRGLIKVQGSQAGLAGTIKQIEIRSTDRTLHRANKLRFGFDSTISLKEGEEVRFTLVRRSESRILSVGVTPYNLQFGTDPLLVFNDLPNAGVQLVPQAILLDIEDPAKRPADYFTAGDRVILRNHPEEKTNILGLPKEVTAIRGIVTKVENGDVQVQPVTDDGYVAKMFGAFEVRSGDIWKWDETKKPFTPKGRPLYALSDVSALHLPATIQSILVKQGIYYVSVAQNAVDQYSVIPGLSPDQKATIRKALSNFTPVVYKAAKKPARSESRIFTESVQEVFQVARNTFPIIWTNEDIQNALKILDRDANGRATLTSMNLVRQAAEKAMAGYSGAILNASKAEKSIHLVLPVDVSTQAEELLPLVMVLAEKGDTIHILLKGSNVSEETAHQYETVLHKKISALGLGDQISQIQIVAVPSDADMVRETRRVAGNQSLQGERGVAAGDEAFLDEVGYMGEARRIFAQEIKNPTVIALLAAAFLRDSKEATLGVQNLKTWMAQKGIKSDVLTARVQEAIAALKHLSASA